MSFFKKNGGNIENKYRRLTKLIMIMNLKLRRITSYDEVRLLLGFFHSSVYEAGLCK